MTNRQLFGTVAAVWVAATCGAAYAAGQAGPGRAATRSTLAGVYTSEQAALGEKTYGSTCLGGCHNKASHTGAAFKQKWEGRPVWELFEVINETMPESDPGFLTPAQTAQIVAYLLKLNAVPAGTDDLPTAEDALKKIKIELPVSKF